MSKPITVLLATGVAVLCITAFAGAADTKSTHRHNAVSVVAVIGPAVKVPPGKFAKAFAYCPKGYYVAGGGSYSGAITEIVSSPTSDLRGWFVDGTNNDAKTTFSHRADAVCVKGSSSVPLGTAASDGQLLRRAEADFRSRH
jgi:hypothetical protein